MFPWPVEEEKDLAKLLVRPTAGAVKENPYEGLGGKE
jgi:hypothetical protein